LLLLAALIASASVSSSLRAEESDQWQFREREITTSDRLRDGAVVFGIAAVLYPITQPAILKGEIGSWRKYRQNFGTLVFDQDEPFWNFLVHPLSGSQMFLYYRGRGYREMDAVVMTALSTALFEFTIEIFSEPASAQDLFNTPVLGSILGYGIEKASFALLNSGTPTGEVVAHIINPTTLFSYHSARPRITPILTSRAKGINLVVDF